MAKDGGIKIEVDVITSKADKQLDDLKQTVEDNADVIEDTFKLDVDQMENSMERAKIRVEELTNALEKTNQELEDMFQMEKEFYDARSVQKEMIDAQKALTEEYNNGKVSLQDFREENKIIVQNFEEAKNKANELSQVLEKIDHIKLDERVVKQTNALDKAVISYEMVGVRAEKLNNKIVQAVDKTKDLEKQTKDVNKAVKEVSVSTKDVTKGISKGISKLGKYAGALFGIRSAYTFLRKLSSEWLNSDAQGARQVQANISAMTSMLSNALAPVLIWLTDLLAKMFAYLNAIVKFFFGIDLMSKKTAKNTSGIAKNTAKARKEAEKFLASFDKAEVVSSNVSDNMGGAGGGGGFDIPEAVFPSVDITPFTKAFDKVKDMIKDVFGSETFKEYLNNWKRIAQSSFEFIKSIGLNLFDNVKNAWDLMFPNVIEGFKNMAELHFNMVSDMADAWEEWSPIIADSINSFVDNIYEMFTPLGVLISEIWRDVWQVALDIWNTYGADILDNVFNFIDSMTNLFNKIWTNIIAPILTPAINFLSDMWHDHLKDLVSEIGAFVASFLNSALRILNEIIIPLISWLTDLLKPAVDFVFGWIFEYGKVVFGALSDFIKLTLEIIRGLFEGFTNFVVGVFTLDWQMAWEGIKQIFSTVWDAIVGLLGIFWNLIVGIIKVNINLVVGIIKAMWQTIKVIWDTIVSVITNLVKSLGINIKAVMETIKTTVSNAFTWVSNKMSSIMTSAVNKVKSIIGGIRTAFANVLSYLTGAFTNGWKKAFNGLKNITQTIATAIGNMFKAPINAMISGINTFIRGLNKVKIPSWVPLVGGRGFSIPQLPRLARGTYADTGSFQAIIGESGKEAVVPLQNNTGWIHDFIDLFNANGGNQGGGGGLRAVIAKIDGRTLFEVNVEEEERNQLILNGA